MTKSTITRERLQEIADDGFLKHGESKVLARMALAAMDSEPVAWRWRWSDDVEGYWRYTEEQRETHGSVKLSGLVCAVLMLHMQLAGMPAAPTCCRNSKKVQEYRITAGATKSCRTSMSSR
ncbi:MAG: hypothetical protein E6525_27575 [Klebsiella grimontii]|nr:hypothetical protein [Klebsiella grimontii]